MKIKSTVFILIALFIAACGAGEAKFEPKVIMKDYVQALKERNVEKLKATVSTKTLKIFEDAAKEQKMSLEDMMKENESNILPMIQNPELRNEKIEGNRATVEIKNPADGKWNKLTFVKEDKRWKIGVGEMLEDVQKQIEKMQKKQPTMEKIPNDNGNKMEEPSNKEESNKQ
ncbi:MAG: hypothetical protein ACR2J3_12765 [Aridibacter sp.]